MKPMYYRLSDSIFETSDIFLAASLQACGFPVIDLAWNDAKRCVLRFKDSPHLQEVVSKFWEERLTLEPQKLFGSLKSLKARIYSSR
jgi:hypothetical protein